MQTIGEQDTKNILHEVQIINILPISLETTEITTKTTEKTLKSKIAEKMHCNYVKCLNFLCYIFVLIEIFFFVSIFLFPILASKTDCGFSPKSSVLMKKYNASVLNSTIYHSEHYENDDYLGQRYFNIYKCFSTIDLESSFICYVHTYSGLNLTKCIESQLPNGTFINAYTTKKTRTCHLKDLSRDCSQSQIYHGLGITGIVIIIMTILISPFIHMCNCYCR